MPHLQKHPKTSVYYYRRAVPEALRPAVGQSEIRISLGTKDTREAKRLLPEKAAMVEAQFAAARKGGASLSHKEIMGLVGAWYRRELATREVEPGNPEDYEHEFDHLELAHDTGNARKAARPVVAELLKRERLVLNEETIRKLETALAEFQLVLPLVLRQRAEGDYTPDPLLDIFPPPLTLETKAHDQQSLSFQSLLDAWAAERKPVQRTFYEWERALNRLRDHTGFSNPTRVTPEHIVSWKNALLASGKSPKTVKNHLFVAHALFAWAMKNRLMTSNPAAGIEIAAKAKAGERGRLPYSDEDAAQLLAAARQEKGAKRWVPWLLAYTGARLEEVCQSFVKDIRQNGGIWYLDINADNEGKALKNDGSVRKVPLHSTLIDEGFLDYVRSLPANGPLLPDLTPDRFERRGGNGTKIIGRWVRAQGIVDSRKAPNHAWRHRFKDLCRGAGIEKAVHDALTGHASRDVGDGYGLGYPLNVLAAAINKLPSLQAAPTLINNIE